MIAELDMPAVAELPIQYPTIEDLYNRYGAMPASRIRLDRYPATEEDVDDLRITTGRFYELVDGVLLEKTMAYAESWCAGRILMFLGIYLMKNNIGSATGPDGTLRLAPGLVRIPDVSFVNWDQFPNRKITSTPIPNLYPDLAVEVLSGSNTKREMEEKLANYFDAGASLVWFVNPKSRTVRVYESTEVFTTVSEAGTLDGGTVLPGFTLPVADIFTELAPATV